MVRIHPWDDWADPNDLEDGCPRRSNRRATRAGLVIVVGFTELTLPATPVSGARC